MREIERLMSIREKMTASEETERFDDAQNAIEAAFRNMLSGTAA